MATNHVNRLNEISVVKLAAICRSHMMLSHLDCRTRASLYAAIHKQDSVVQEAIDVGVELAIQSGLVKYGRARERREAKDGQGHCNLKRPWLLEEEREAKDGQGHCKRPRLDEEERESIETHGEFLIFLKKRMLWVLLFFFFHKKILEERWSWMIWRLENL